MAENDTTIRDLLLIGVVGGVGIYAARMLLKPAPGGGGTVVVPPLPQIPIPKDDDAPAPPVIVMPQLPQPQNPQIIMPQIPNPDNGSKIPTINITLPNGETYTPPLTPDPDPVRPDPIVPEDPEEPDPVKPEEPTPTPEPKQDLPPPQNIPEWNTDVGTWTARSLNLSGANGGVLQHVEKWSTEKEKRMDANPDRKGIMWEAYYGLTSSPGAVKVGNFFKNLGKK